MDRLRGMESVESDVGYLEVNVVFSGEPMELLEKSTTYELG